MAKDVGLLGGIADALGIIRQELPRWWVDANAKWRADITPADVAEFVFDSSLNVPLGLLSYSSEAEGAPKATAAANGLLGKVKKAAKQSGLLGKYATTTPQRIINQTRAQGGYSVNLPTGDVPTSGLMMGIYRNDDARNMVLDALSQRNVQDFAYTNRVPLGQSDKYFGTLANKDNGKYYFDVSRRFEPDEIRKATKFGERTHQLKGYDVGKGQEIPVGNWEEFVRSQAFTDRMHELSAEGNAYMATHPRERWWDMHGTTFEDVYPQNMPQVAGFTAATAPNELVRKNVAEMTEYMRRLLKGEPIVQPNWRMPEDGLLFQKGTQMPMELSRKNNLTKAAAGRIDELSADKVRNEAQAMMGDPSAIPLDVYWARVAEDPSIGVFTATKEGVVPPGKIYEILKDVVSGHAIRAGDTPANYSAKIWAAIRERIKNTGNLFGQKYRAGGASLGESKGYADHFDDLINEKSKFLGISKDEMMKRLSSGDANLMSVLLASPLVAYVYDEVAKEVPAVASKDGA